MERQILSGVGVSAELYSTPLHWLELLSVFVVVFFDLVVVYITGAMLWVQCVVIEAVWVGRVIISSWPLFTTGCMTVYGTGTGNGIQTLWIVQCDPITVRGFIFVFRGWVADLFTQANTRLRTKVLNWLLVPKGVDIDIITSPVFFPGSLTAVRKSNRTL